MILAGALVLLFSAGALVLAPYHQPGGEEGETGEMETITIELGNFFFRGPEGQSSATDDPGVVARLENGKAYKLVFQNTADTVHQVVSPLFNDQDLASGTLAQADVRTVQPGESLVMKVTPDLLTVEDGQTLTFHLSCHVGHGTDSDHFELGMHALIEVVPQG